MKKDGFTLIEILAVIIVISIIMTLVVPEIMKDYNDAQDKALISYANKIKKSANEYVITHRNEMEKGTVQKNIKDIMSDTGKYEGNIYIFSDGNSYINNLKVTGQNRKLCNINLNEEIDESMIKHNNEVCDDGITSEKTKDTALISFANKVREKALEYKKADIDESSDNEFILVANISDIMTDTSNYYGYISVRYDGSTYINYIGEVGENRILCNIDSNINIKENMILRKSFCQSENIIS